jgi:hypothetical protein
LCPQAKFEKLPPLKLLLAAHHWLHVASILETLSVSRSLVLHHHLLHGEVSTPACVAPSWQACRSA